MQKGQEESVKEDPNETQKWDDFDRGGREMFQKAGLSNSPVDLSFHHTHTTSANMPLHPLHFDEMSCWVCALDQHHYRGRA